MQNLSEPVPLIARAGNWARWETLTLLGLLSVYVALATYKIHSPGIYYDEILSLAPAAGEQPYLKCFGLPLMVFPYIGALKSWIYTPIFALFGVSPVTVRLPTILISCGTLALGYSLVRRILGPRWAVAFTGACAVHPGFVFLTKVDWGPIALMLFLKALCLVLLFKWLEGPQRICWSVFGVCILGFFDKFNFIWFVVSLAFSTSAIYGPEIFRKLRSVPLRALVAIAIALVAIGLLVLWIVYPILQKPHTQGFAGRFSHMIGSSVADELSWPTASFNVRALRLGISFMGRAAELTDIKHFGNDYNRNRVGPIKSRARRGSAAATQISPEMRSKLNALAEDADLPDKTRQALRA